ncbi:MAG: hypothetical protein K2Q10_12755, partial [Rhodospirillales bacterium]|nr:hypothetical protein [Rhodospirillales bacterium]
MTDLPPRRRTRLVTVEEAALWRLVVRDARPLHAETVPAVPALPNEPPPASPPPLPPVASKPAPPPLPLARPLPPPPPAYLQHGHAPGVDKRTGE